MPDFGERIAPPGFARTKARFNLSRLELAILRRYAELTSKS